MKTQNMILTSVLALVIASPAMAEVGDVITTGAQCTIDDLGVSSGTANATAQFRKNTYNCVAGTYLPDGDDWLTEDQGCTTCPADSYCPGSGNTQFTYSESDNQGITACPGEYPSSDTNSGSADSCYRACTTADVAYSEAVTGRYYAGGATPNQCAPASCVPGYHYVAASAPTLPSASTNGNSREYHSHDNQSINPANTTLSSGEWSVTWTDTGIMKGIASCNSTAGDNQDYTFSNDSSNWSRSGDTFNSNSEGRYCWCKPTSWTPSGEAEQSLSAAWVFRNDHGAASSCALDCADYCARNVYVDAAFRTALFGGVGATSSQCVANTISLNWNDEEGEVFTTGQCTYNEPLATPDSHPDKRGHTFIGWMFSNPSEQ